MPMLIEHIDAIARAKGRDVVYVTFPACDQCTVLDDHDDPNESEDYGNYAPRQALISWLDENGIGWSPCAFFANESVLIWPYDGRIYIDVPFDLLNEHYQKVAAHLENPDGTPRIEGVLFWYVPLEMAMKNRHHDEPGYWEKRAETW